MTLGRPNKGADHVDALDSSAESRERLRVILQTITGERSVDDACAWLRISRTRFKQLRQQSLQGAADALEPGRPGRPRKRDAETEQRVKALEAKLEAAQQSLDRERLRADLAVSVPELLSRSEKGGSRGRSRWVRRPS